MGQPDVRPDEYRGGVDERDWAAVDTPLGVVFVSTTESGVRGVKLPGSRAPAAHVSSEPTGVLAAAVDEIRAYFDGQLRSFTLPIDWSRVDGFRRRVLSALYEGVPFGSLISYGDLGARAGDPTAARAVGEAMAANPYPIVVPCHRVVAGDGLGGFGGGLDMKRWLLAHEGVLPPMLDFGS
jgi:methylated-DNA-[protein]-cysteine S-methyltransferase